MTQELVQNPDDSMPSHPLFPVVPRFRNVAAFRLVEDSNVHLENGDVVQGKAGDWVLQIDYFAFVVVSNIAFRALFKSPPATI
jgi:hypothetical protein